MKTILNSIFLVAMVTIGMVTGARAQRLKIANIVEEEVTYTVDGKTMKSYVAFDGNQNGVRPAVVVVPEWWGLNDYTRRRARMLAGLGYIAIAADMYGDGKTADNPKTAQEYAMPFYKDPQKGKAAIEAAMTKIKQYPQTAQGLVAAVGYCFGGSMVLNAAKMGSDLRGVVSFHGGLATAPAKKGSVKGQILVCHGEADKFVSAEDKKNFLKNLDTADVKYQFIGYKDATHAFTNPESTENGKKFNMPIAYNEAADKKSWEDMKAFLKRIF